MDFFEVIGSRRSIRAYKPDAVEDATLERVLDAARLAPTANDQQPFRVIVLPTQGREAELRRVYDRAWFVSAPYVLVVCHVAAEAWVRPADGKNFAVVDATIATVHMILAATALGLGTCWIAHFDVPAAKALLSAAPGWEPGWEPTAMTPLGYPAETPGPRPRKALGDMVIRL
jgi:nitroreductase